MQEYVGLVDWQASAPYLYLVRCGSSTVAGRRSRSKKTGRGTQLPMNFGQPLDARQIDSRSGITTDYRTTGI